MANFAVVRDGVVENVISVDDIEQFPGVSGCLLVPLVDGFWIGDTFSDGQFSQNTPSSEPTPTRTKRQINAALILSGLTTEPEGWMDGILANIPDPLTRALALNDRRNAPYYERSNPLFNDPNLLTLAGLTAEQVDALWAAAGDLPV